MSKEYECCIPKEFKDRFLENAYSRAGINRIIGYLHQNNINDLELKRELIDASCEIEGKEFNLWGEIFKMFPDLDRNKFIFNGGLGILYYYEEEGE